MYKINYKKRPNPVAKQLREPRYKKQVTSDKTKYSRPRQKKTSLEECYDIIKNWWRKKSYHNTLR